MSKATKQTGKKRASLSPTSAVIFDGHDEKRRRKTESPQSGKRTMDELEAELLEYEDDQMSMSDFSLVEDVDALSKDGDDEDESNAAVAVAALQLGDEAKEKEQFDDEANGDMDIEAALKKEAQRKREAEQAEREKEEQRKREAAKIDAAVEQPPPPTASDDAKMDDEAKKSVIAQKRTSPQDVRSSAAKTSVTKPPKLRSRSTGRAVEAEQREARVRGSVDSLMKHRKFEAAFLDVPAAIGLTLIIGPLAAPPSMREATTQLMRIATRIMVNKDGASTAPNVVGDERARRRWKRARQILEANLHDYGYAVAPTPDPKINYYALLFKHEDYAKYLQLKDAMEQPTRLGQLNGGVFHAADLTATLPTTRWLWTEPLIASSQQRRSKSPSKRSSAGPSSSYVRRPERETNLQRAERRAAAARPVTHAIAVEGITPDERRLAWISGGLAEYGLSVREPAMLVIFASEKQRSKDEEKATRPDEDPKMSNEASSSAVSSSAASSSVKYRSTAKTSAASSSAAGCSAMEILDDDEVMQPKLDYGEAMWDGLSTASEDVGDCIDAEPGDVAEQWVDCDTFIIEMPSAEAVRTFVQLGLPLVADLDRALSRRVCRAATEDEKLRLGRFKAISDEACSNCFEAGHSKDTCDTHPGRCWGCLKIGHNRDRCDPQNKRRCRFCGGRHLTGARTCPVCRLTYPHQSKRREAEEAKASADDSVNIV